MSTLSDPREEQFAESVAAGSAPPMPTWSPTVTRTSDAPLISC
jgi:hypothetical protein